MKIKKLIKLVIAWRLWLTLASLLAINLIPFKPSFPYTDALLAPLGPKLLHAWANFDGVHYLTIIQKGYLGTGLIQAFFPLYPLLVKFAASLLGNPILAGVVLSTACFFLSLVVLFKLIKLDYSSTIAQKTLFLVLLFPTSFFFTAFYTESLFFLLVLLAFYSARQGRFLSAGIYGALASATRLVGVFLLPALLVELWLQKKKHFLKISNLPNLLASLIPATGLLTYMWYLKKVFADALLFIHVQPEFGVARETNRIILLYQVFWRYLCRL